MSELALNLRNNLVNRQIERSDDQIKDSDSIVTLGGILVHPGIYSRGKDSAKAFLIINEDGEAYYENKSGVRKRLTENAFLSHWNKGLSVLVTDKID